MAKNKALGADILAFYEAWPMGDDWCHEQDDGETAITDDLGLPAIDPAAEYDLRKIGPICWQGRDPFGCGALLRGQEVGRTLSFASEFRKWQAQQTHVSLVLRVPKEQEAEALEIAKARGWLP
jgi:hypothetical protein